MYTRPLYAAGNSQPATNVLGFRNDTKRLRGKYLADCSPFHRRPRNPEPATSDSKIETRNSKLVTPNRPTFIDDGD